jgi:hypothetical protein
MIRRLASLPWLRPGAVRQLRRYYQGAMTSCRPSRRTSLPSFGGTSAFTRSFRSSADECAAEAWSWSPGGSGRDCAEETTGSPKFLGNPHCRLPCSVDAGRTAGTRPVQCSSVAPGIRTAKAPAKGLSTLNSMAFGLAVYASPRELPRFDARLASSRWSDATGRAFHPQGSNERFQSVSLTSHPPSPSFAWRNHIDRDVSDQRASKPDGG